MAKSRRQRVIDRADNCCEYCQLPQQCTSLPHELDHIRSQKLHGPTVLDNLCLACAPCNSAKGPLASGYDPDTNELIRLFNPRADNWDDHFDWNGPTLVGKTPIGRATIDVLNINDTLRVEHRGLLIQSKRFPPLRTE
ncbi:MAG TPA: HNH endonuclease [Pirellulaceae bacterium]|nr:HNH endonuclease [Pirellulaceae bacterium]